MPGRAYGNLEAAGRASKGAGKMTRRGPGQKNVQSTARRQADPRMKIRSTGQQVKGPDKGTGGGS